MTDEKLGEWDLKKESGVVLKIPEGVYKASLVDVGKTSVTDETGTRNLILLKFKIEGGSEDGKEIQGLASWKLSEMSKLCKWLEALGVSVKVGETLNVRNGIGKKAQIVVKDKRRTFNNETTIVSVISDVLKA